MQAVQEKKQVYYTHSSLARENKNLQECQGVQYE